MHVKYNHIFYSDFTVETELLPRLNLKLSQKHMLIYLKSLKTTHLRLCSSYMAVTFQISDICLNSNQNIFHNKRRVLALLLRAKQMIYKVKQSTKYAAAFQPNSEISMLKSSVWNNKKHTLRINLKMHRKSRQGQLFDLFLHYLAKHQRKFKWEETWVIKSQQHTEMDSNFIIFFLQLIFSSFHNCMKTQLALIV